MNKIKAFFKRLDQRLPVKARCGHWVRKSEAEYLYHRAFGRVTVCPACYDSEHAWDKVGLGND